MNIIFIRRFLCVLSLLCCANFFSNAISPSYSVLEDKAQRFFDNKDWASAEAMYQLMIEERPDDASLYAAGIVTAGMRNNEAMQMRFMNDALKAHVNQDSLFASVEKISFSVGNSTLYEHFLLSAADNIPWLRRAIDARLLNYYAFRRNAPMMIEYSRRMLSGMPDNISFMLTLAQGQLLENDVENAVVTYQHIVEKSPKCYEALLYLGMYYMDRYKSGDTNSATYAAEYLRAANELRPAPYVENMLRDIDSASKKHD